MKTIKRPMPMPEMAMPGGMLPSFSLNAKDLPAIKNWQVGKRYRLEIEVEETEMGINEYQEGQPMTARFRIHKVKDISLSDHDMKARKGY